MTMRTFLLKVIDKLFPPKPKPPSQYLGCICDFCGQVVKIGEKAKHVKEAHPEIPLRTEVRCGIHSDLTYYYCTICNKTVCSVSGMIKHYKAVHV